MSGIFRLLCSHISRNFRHSYFIIILSLGIYRWAGMYTVWHTHTYIYKYRNQRHTHTFVHIYVYIQKLCVLCLHVQEKNALPKRESMGWSTHRGRTLSKLGHFRGDGRLSEDSLKTLWCSQKTNISNLKLMKHCNAQEIQKLTRICFRPGHRCQNLGMLGI